MSSSKISTDNALEDVISECPSCNKNLIHSGELCASCEYKEIEKFFTIANKIADEVVVDHPDIAFNIIMVIIQATQNIKSDEQILKFLEVTERMIKSSIEFDNMKCYTCHK